MNSDLIQETINGQEPTAIIKYCEWPIFSNNYANTRYIILRVDKKHDNFDEIVIPFNEVPFVNSKTGHLKGELRLNEGIV
ncbi:hypothetical protein C21_03402 [Arenibacter sp. NBRC 103722]|uniref:hypothetical protein n=1 Tax=Arenibacter sp. NBRC 103722 TaxID=1113929 RepID=UPI000857EFEF|nr:hypothetical protein [Arenibacter sp. NBRC 103722]GBF21219.1 hypothetical protein C21_03402 [Arenibacter sp. NBRC 103722]